MSTFWRADTSTFLPEPEVKGHLASLLNDALIRIKMLEQQLQLEQMKNGTFNKTPFHSSPGRETYISPRQYETQKFQQTPESPYSTSSSSIRSRSGNKKTVLGAFSPKGSEFIHSFKNMAWAEELRKGPGEHSGLQNIVTNGNTDINNDEQVSTTFSLAEAKNLQQSAARNKRTCDQLRDSLASIQHEKTKFEMQHNHIKGKLLAANDKNLELERRILDLKERMESELNNAKMKIKKLSGDSSELGTQIERNKELEEMMQEMKNNSIAQSFVLNSRKSQLAKLKENLNDEKNQKQALATRITELTQEKRRLEGMNNSQIEKINQYQHELENTKKELIMKIDEFDNINGDKLKADDTVHQLKIDLESRKTHLQEAEEKISDLKSKVMDLEAQILRMENSIRNDKNVQASVKDSLENELREMTHFYKDVKDKLKLEKEESNRLTKKIQEIQIRCNTLTEEVSVLKDEARQAKDDMHRAELRIQTEEDEIHGLRDQVQGLQLELEREHEQVETLKQEYSKAASNVSNAKSQSNVDRESIRRLEGQVKSKTKALEKERNDGVKLRKVKMDLEIAVDHERREKEVAKERVNMLDQRIVQMEKDYDASMGKMQQLNRTIDNSQMQMQALHDQKQQVTRECDGLKDEVDRLKTLLQETEENVERVENEKRKELKDAEERYKVLERALENLRKNINLNSKSSKRGGRRQSQIQVAAANAAATSVKASNDLIDVGEHDEDLRLRAMFNKGKQGSQKSPMMIKFEKESILRSLSNSTTFKDIPKEALHDMINHSNVYTFNVGDYVIKQGEMGSRMYIIANGKVKITRTLVKVVDGNEVEVEQNLINRTLGQFFGEFAMIADAVRTANVIADSSPMKCLGIDRAAYELLNRQYNDVFGDAFAPHKVGANQSQLHIPSSHRKRAASRYLGDRSKGSSRESM